MKIYINNFKFKWLVVFVITIFVFAGIYWFMPDSFYHSTTWYEPTIRVADVQIKNQLMKDIKTNFINRHQHHSVYLTNAEEWILNIDDLEISKIKFENDGFILTFGTYITNSIDVEHSKDKSKFTQYFTLFDVKFGKEFLVVNDVYTLYGERIYSDVPDSILYNLNLATLDFTLIFSDNVPKPYIGLALSDSTYKDLVNYNKLHLGIPQRNFNNFVRMFYFSTITITTLGFGDIVPLTTTARILVSIEAILGIILLGLFVNDVLKERLFNKKVVEYAGSKQKGKS